MTPLARADWIRLRHRYDLWIVVLGALLLGVLAYWSGAGSAGRAADQIPIDLSMPADIRAQIAAQNAQLAEQAALLRDQYVFPRSVITMLTIGNWLFMAAAFVTASWLATEFDWATIRNVFLAEPRRARFLTVRVAMLVAVSAGAVAALMLLGALLPLAIPLTGSAAPAAVTPLAIALTAAGDLAWSVAFVAVAALAALITRSPVLALIATYGYFLVEGIVDNAAIWETAGSPLEWARQFLLGFRLNVLTGDIRTATSLALPFEPAPTVPPVHLEPLAGAAVIAAWVVVLLGASVLVLRRADIRE